MSQPFDRGAVCPAPAKPDEKLDEFWSGSAWNISNSHNLSGYERNRTYLNTGTGDFVDISHVTGADSDGDGAGDMCIVFADNDFDGKLTPGDKFDASSDCLGYSLNGYAFSLKFNPTGDQIYEVNF